MISTGTKITMLHGQVSKFRIQQGKKNRIRFTTILQKNQSVSLLRSVSRGDLTLIQNKLLTT